MPLDRGIFESSPDRPSALEEQGHAAEQFLLRLGALLHAYGTPADQLEAELAAIAAGRGVEGAHFLSTPTGLQVAFGPLHAQRVHLMRVPPGETALAKLCELQDIAEAVRSGRLNEEAATIALERVAARSPRFGRGAVAFAFGVASAGAARFFGGGLLEVALTFALAIVVASLPRLLGQRRNPIGLFEPLAGFLAAFFAAALARVLPVQASILTLASLVVLLPGLSLTLAFAELAARHLVSGTARLFGAATTFLGLTLGIALAHALATRVLPEALIVEPTNLPPWTFYAAVLVTPPAFAVLFQARMRELPWIFASGICGLCGAFLGKLLFGPMLAGFVGALLVGLVGEVYVRTKRGPALVATLPGLLMLVPGSIGLESLTLFLAEDSQHGVEGAFRTVLAALALVGGILTARAMLPTRVQRVGLRAR